MAKTAIPIYPKNDLYQWGPIPAVPYYLLGPGTAVVQEVYKEYKIHWAEGLMVYSDKDKCLWYNRQSEIDDNGYKAAKLIYKNKNSERKLKKRYSDVIAQIAAFRRGLTPTKLKNLNDRELWSAYEQVLNTYNVFWSVATLAELAGYGATAYLQAHQQYIPGGQSHDSLHVLTSAADLTFYQKEEVAFLNMLAKIQNNLKSQRGQLTLKAHTEKYNWLLNNFGEAKPLTVDYFSGRARDYLKKYPRPGQTAKNILAELRATNIKRKAIASRITDLETKFYAQIAGQALAWHDDRKGWQMRMQTVLHFFLQEFSRRLHLPDKQLVQLLPQELGALAKGKKAIDDFPIRSRQKLMVAYVSTKKLTIVHGQEAKKIVASYKRQEQQKNNDGKLEGLVASTGNKQVLTGKVKVIQDASQLNKMKQGFILVSQFTSPDYIMAIRKATAIITDIGGLNSHAAVVSRELGIPCIVNTKLATKILKDGDTVEIDTKIGTINKL